MNAPVPFVCESGWGWCPLCRWRPSLHCTLTQWWRDAGTGCCSGRWWTDAFCELRCSCLGCWMHSACGSSAHILQGATLNQRTREHIWWVLHFICQRNLWSTSKCLLVFTIYLPVFLTVTLEPLSDQPEQHLSAVITEGRGPVGVHIECMGPNLEIFKCGCRFKVITRVECGHSGCQDIIMLL